MSQDIIVCDLDGTLASCGWRRHFVEPGEGQRHKDWKSFFNGIPFDPVIPAVKKMLEDFEQEGFKIVYVSARPDSYRRQTVDWLTKHHCPGGPPFELYMRAAADSRHDPIVKQEILDNQLAKYKDRIHKVIDDRPQVQEMWLKNGLDVVKVTDPNLKPAIFPDESPENVASMFEALAESLGG